MDGTETAYALFDALDAGDLGRYASFFRNDAVIWHNYDNRDQLPAELVARLKAGKDLGISLRYDDRRYVSTPDGAIVQFVAHLQTKDGRTRKIHAMMRIYADGGRVSRIEEYLDPAQAAVDQ